MKNKLIKSIIPAVMVVTLILTGCGKSSSAPNNNSGGNSTEGNGSSNSEVSYPITIKHAFGETVIEEKPERIATISWGNHDVPLALGVVPVGISEANYGVTDGSGLLPWTINKYKELGEENPVLFNDVAGLDFEAINDVQPDIILAAYSGITQEEYALLSEIAPVIAYPSLPWQTLWREQITINAEAIGMKAEGEAMVKELEELIDTKAKDYPQIAGKKTAFLYFNPADLGKFYVYLPSDPRAAYLTDLGMPFPESVTALAKESDSFSIELSSENVDVLNDVDIIITYGTDTLLAALQADSLVGTIPAVKRGSVAVIEDGTPLAASGTPSALSIPATIDEYLTIIGEAADKVK
ncbi:iron-siderophore ABC transporter substrate-binding protein [Alloiococcus sp. CFN-8]|uniref:iron-siderophore ABC transporter substrate-binding protein n=1 Tax=Alloiococcus sp. CFN-8 TaxID=3416081 RepID=UPI003CF7E0DB